MQTCRGSHTHTLVTDPEGQGQRLHLRLGNERRPLGARSWRAARAASPTKDPNTSLFRIDIIKVPLARPEQAQDRQSPAHLHRSPTGAIDGLWKGGNHGDGHADAPSMTNQCHDITVYSAIGLAAGACSGNGILLDISDPANPKRIAAVSDPNFAYWHSATFNNDGTKVAVHRRMGRRRAAALPRDRPAEVGRRRDLHSSNGKLTLGGYYKMPAAQTEQENCVAHNGSLIPVPGRDIMVQAWYQGGVSVLDFTDAAHPDEIAYFDRGPIDATQAGASAATGRRTGTTATSTARRSRAGWTCSS